MNKFDKISKILEKAHLKKQQEMPKEITEKVPEYFLIDKLAWYSTNENGNLCLIGHNWRNKRFFSKVPTLEIGDIVQITDLSERTVEYEVYDIHTVDPKNVADTTQEVEGREVTLITCTDDSKERVVVRCKEKK